MSLILLVRCALWLAAVGIVAVVLLWVLEP